MWKSRILALVVLVAGLSIGYFDYVSQSSTSRWLSFPFKLGLDLSGGTHLVYEADTSNISDADISDAMSSLRGVIERRVNLFGVSEPIVQVEGGLSGGHSRLIVELPGVTDVDAAIKLIDKTPNLEFKIERPAGAEKDAIVAAYQEAQKVVDAGGQVEVSLNPLLKEDPNYISSGLTGRYLKRAQVSFNQNAITPVVSIEFNTEGAKLFREITEANVGKTVAIYLDGVAISEPTVNEAIKDGKAEISGNFTTDTAKSLARDLNLGALPVPITLVSTQTIGATLGDDAITKGVTAAFYGFIAIAVFLILWYRLPGLVAVVALTIYIALVLAVYKLVPITLTSAGIAGFILSMGMAVDANILIFERMKEELRGGKELRDSTEDGFRRAWFSIRDSNVSGLITAIILFWFGESLIEGFALTFILGVIISMFSAIVVTRVLLRASGIHKATGISKFLFGSGLN